MSTQPQTILITGATAGIGRRTALDLAAAGHRVIASGRRVDALAALAAESPSPIHTVRLDVTDAASISAAVVEVDRITDGHGLDVLVNNAGYGIVGPTELVSDADLKRQYETNVFGLMAVTRAFLPRMRQRGSGRIINVSSMGGRMTLPLMGVYNSTKYALESLSDALRLELAMFGIQVVLIEPGYIRTEFTHTSMKEAEAYRDAASPYAAAMLQLEAAEKKMGKTAVGPEYISRAIHAAIRARRPRARYVAPLSGHLLFVLLAVLPTSWVDAVFRRLTGLTAPRRQSRPATPLAAG